MLCFPFLRFRKKQHQKAAIPTESNSTPNNSPQLVTAVKLASQEKNQHKALFNRSETSKRIDLVNKKGVPEKTYEKVATITKKPIKNGLSPNKTNPDNKPRSNKLNTKGNVASLSQSTSEEDEEIYSRADIKSSGRKNAVRTEKGERTEMPLYSNEKMEDTDKMFLSHLDEDIATLSEKLFNQGLDLGVTDLCAFNSSELLIHTLVGNTKEFPVEANLQSAVKEFAIENRQEEEMKMILHEHESKKEKKKEPFSPDLYNNTYNLYNDLLLMTPLCNTKTAPYAFRSNKLKTNGNLVSLTQSTYEEDYLRAKISRRKNAVITENGERTMKTLYSKENLEDINKMILLQVDEDIAKFSENLVNPWLELCVTETDYTFSSNRTLSKITSNLLPSCSLPNFDSNCYINASLQCLFTAETFCKELSDLLENASPHIDDKFSRSFVKLSKLRSSSELQSNDNVNSLLMDLITSAAQVNPEFTFFQENDAHEFLCHCLTQLKESVQRLRLQKNVMTRCPVGSNFFFKMRNIISCSSCEFTRSKVEVFNHISVPPNHNSLEKCFHDLLNTQTVLESNCEKCGGKSATSLWVLHTLPRFLILHLNRFKVTQSGTISKLTTKVEIPPELLISRHSQLDAPKNENSSDEASETDQNELVENNIQDEGKSSYRLISFISHIGRTQFSADCFTKNSDLWMSCNDEIITLVNKTDLLELGLSSAYVLLYERVSTDGNPA
ncbi:ubiquitin carboxyl-terminal hydrolase 37-like isoform X2 [Silurus meridionalis]|uniref:ubiquitin carboxyl-terminal hydrolase 37-like isoform X2 n=1 Tax=Silurus meridionalis TaxID=175797 RepID=UPI001EEA863F|nr:ubiquitin carboxyl-terminal hydrolase 37-like isoform X2 [Silurus meridionalis]